MSGKKWLNRRRNVEDIRDFVSVNGKVLKPSNVASPPHKRRPVLGSKRVTRQSLLFDGIRKDEVEAQEKISAMKFSRGVRNKSAKFTKENEIPARIDKAISMTDAESEHILIHEPSKQLIPCHSITDVSHSIGHCDLDIDNEHVDEVTASSSRSFCSGDESIPALSEENESEYCSHLITNELSTTTIMNILKCDTEDFINNL